MVRDLESTEPTGAGIWLAAVQLALGRKDLAVRALERAAEAGEPHFAFAFVDPRLAELRGVPAFERLRAELGPPALRDDA